MSFKLFADNLNKIKDDYVKITDPEVLNHEPEIILNRAQTSGEEVTTF